MDLIQTFLNRYRELVNFSEKLPDILYCKRRATIFVGKIAACPVKFMPILRTGVSNRCQFFGNDDWRCQRQVDAWP